MDQRPPTSALYANLFRIGHNLSEFVIEFCQAYPRERTAAQTRTVVARIVVTPEGAKELQSLLSESLDQHARIAARRQPSGPEDARP